MDNRRPGADVNTSRVTRDRKPARPPRPMSPNEAAIGRWRALSRSGTSLISADGR